MVLTGDGAVARDADGGTYTATANFSPIAAK